MPGVVIDRYGHTGGKFVATPNVPFEARGLPPEYLSKKPYNTYEVMKPIHVQSGFSMPAFNQPGLGVQYELPVSVQTLLNKGFVKPIKK